jgi:hypothetical protein
MIRDPNLLFTVQYSTASQRSPTEDACVRNLLIHDLLESFWFTLIRLKQHLPVTLLF